MAANFRELDHRRSDRIDIRLLWREDDGQVIVTVADEKTGDRFTIEVREDESAVDVFHHPYAYAAYHGIDTRSGVTSLGDATPIAAF